MIEKFSDYESTKYIDKAGEFLFTINNAELKTSQSGNDMVVFEVSSDEGSSNIYISLVPKARWKYNNLIKACLHLDTKEKIQALELDYSTFHQKLIGKQFIGVVEEDSYTKEVKVANPDGTFSNELEERISYKINDFKMA